MSNRCLECGRVKWPGEGRFFCYNCTKLLNDFLRPLMIGFWIGFMGGLIA